MQPLKGDLSTHGRLISLRNKPQQKQPRHFQHQYLSELLVNVYSYRLMVKMCLAVVCVEGIFSQIWSHTSLYTLRHANSVGCFNMLIAHVLSFLKVSKVLCWIEGWVYLLATTHLFQRNIMHHLTTTMIWIKNLHNS